MSDQTDVRMRGFTRRDTVEAALAWLDSHVKQLSAETIPLKAAAGRVLADAVTSDADVPGFDRSTMDGYAVTADSTDGASAYNALALEVIGESLPGRPFQGRAAANQAVRIMTGARMPSGCDAVLPARPPTLRLAFPTLAQGRYLP